MKDLIFHDKGFISYSIVSTFLHSERKPVLTRSKNSLPFIHIMPYVSAFWTRFEVEHLERKAGHIW